MLATTAPGAMVHTDEWRAYGRVAELGRGHAAVNHGAGEWARDDDGDGVREVHVNTMEGTWTGLRNFLRPFRGVSKWYLIGYVAMFEWANNLKRVTDGFLGQLLGTPAFHRSGIMSQGHYPALSRCSRNLPRGLSSREGALPKDRPHPLRPQVPSRLDQGAPPEAAAGGRRRPPAAARPGDLLGARGRDPRGVRQWDHVNMFVSCSPRVSPTYLMQRVEGKSSRESPRRFSHPERGMLGTSPVGEGVLRDEFGGGHGRGDHRVHPGAGRDDGDGNFRVDGE